MIFKTVANLHEMEQNEQWESIRVSLLVQWEANRNDLGILIRLASECWLVLSLWGFCIDNDGLDYNLFKSSLIQSYVYGSEKFGDDEVFLCLLGYMLSCFPYFFYTNNDPKSKDYLCYERKGIEMLKKAHQKDPKNLLSKVLFLGSTTQTKQYTEAREALKPYLSSLFPGDTAIEQYFTEILCN